MNLLFKILVKIVLKLELKNFLKLFTILSLIANINHIAKSQERARWLEIKSDIHPKGRAGACMAQIENGKVLMYGGQDFDGYFLDDLWMFDLQTNKWTQIFTEHSPGARSSSKLVSVTKDKLILFGGSTNNFAASNDLFLFDLNKMDWEELTPNGECEKRTKHSMAKLSEGKIIIFGGDYWGSNGSLEWKYPYIRFYDINTNQWSNVFNDFYGDPMGTGGSEMLGIKDDMVLLFGGERTGKMNNTVKLFNFKNEEGFRWTNNISKNYTHGRGQFGIAKMDEKVLVFGGYAYNFNDSVYLDRYNDTWLYNIEDSLWTELKFNVKPEGRFLHCMSELTNNKALMFGGLGLKDVYYTNTWIFEYDSLVTEIQNQTEDENKLKITLNNSNELIIDNSDNALISFELFNYMGQIVPSFKNDLNNNQIRINFENKNNQFVLLKIQNNNQIQIYSIIGNMLCKK